MKNVTGIKIFTFKCVECVNTIGYLCVVQYYYTMASYSVYTTCYINVLKHYNTKM